MPPFEAGALIAAIHKDWGEAQAAGQLRRVSILHRTAAQVAASN
jgi:hypothetical protein